MDIPIVIENIDTRTAINVKPQIDKQKETHLRDFLFKPKTPERKGNRNIERIPYVLSSSAAKEMFEEKEREKERKLKVKQNAKIKRGLQLQKKIQ